MINRTARLLPALLMLVVACGSDENDTSGANNGANNGASTQNNGTANNGEANNGADSTFWHAEFSDSDVELPPANGQFLMVTQSDELSKITSSNNVTGVFLDSSFPSRLMVGEMAPTGLKISFVLEGYACVADSDLRVTFDSVDPTRGSFTGPMTCSDADQTMEFSATVTSSFSED